MKHYLPKNNVDKIASYLNCAGIFFTAVFSDASYYAMI